MDGPRIALRETLKKKTVEKKLAKKSTEKKLTSTSKSSSFPVELAPNPMFWFVAAIVAAVEGVIALVVVGALFTPGDLDAKFRLVKKEKNW